MRYEGMTRLTFLIMTAMGVAACRQEAEQPPPPKPKIQVQGEGQKQMRRFNDLNRAIALKRAISASGQRCRRITESGYVAEYGNLSMWMARCEDGRDWSIFISPDDSAQVRPCADHAQLKLPECKLAKRPAA